ncbi:hypothetical protein P170DRAFT_221269 [Aspergillus steynii IBT 23096]|uniref:EthD domain-containing protein n=1 Tax=Aspergillus steynii IBT 23096 TaxID=1392250 RepID=A0A2I2G1J9_9EURO|nr:uncharacterized protein P170DRAFT_221269 [Aspergillus steynii IBT 23096]PLB46736.1 hypothetical protein P170DRAFT_221269 [Aspergillus steynii IBT 23096]
MTKTGYSTDQPQWEMSGQAVVQGWTGREVVKWNETALAFFVFSRQRIKTDLRPSTPSFSRQPSINHPSHPPSARMSVRLIITSSRKPGLSPEAFKFLYEVHVDLIKRLAPDTFPLCHRRSYLARTTVSSPPDDATSRNRNTPATVLRGAQSDFDFDATAELTFVDQAAFERFAARMQEPHVAEEIGADEEQFLERSTVAIAMIDGVCETKKD